MNNKTVSILVIAMPSLFGCSDSVLVGLRPVDVGLVEDRVMSDLQKPQLGADIGYSNGRGDYGYMSHMIPQLITRDDTEALTYFRRSPVVWTIPMRTVQLAWEVNVRAESDELGYTAEDPLDVGLCVWGSSKEHFLVHPQTKAQFTTEKDLEGFKEGQLLTFDERYFGDVKDAMQKQVDAQLVSCTAANDDTPNPFNYPREMTDNCVVADPCPGVDRLCGHSACNAAVTGSVAYHAEVLWDGKSPATSDLRRSMPLGPSINVAAPTPAPAPDQNGIIDISNAPASAPSASRVIRPLTWSPADNAWVWTAYVNHEMIENFTLDYVVGAVRVFSVNTIDVDWNAGPMQYPGYEHRSYDGKRRVRVGTRVSYQFQGAPDMPIIRDIPFSCVDHGAGVSVSNCHMTSSTTPSFDALDNQEIATPITWLVDIPDSHPNERQSFEGLIREDWSTCDFSVGPASIRTTPCWSRDGDILLINQYYIEFYRVGQGDGMPTPTIPLPDPDSPPTIPVGP